MNIGRFVSLATAVVITVTQWSALWFQALPN